MTNKQLITLIDNFGEAKTTADDFKKKADDFNKELKSYFSTAETTEISSEKFKVKYSVATSRSFDEEKLIMKLKEIGATDCIKTVEVVDMNNLENAIYNKKIDAAVLADCEVIKETEKLNLYKVKKED